jgi:hypothetical protein
MQISFYCCTLNIEQIKMVEGASDRLTQKYGVLVMNKAIVAIPILINFLEIL